jgi:phage tail sheath protein FI
MSATTSFVGTRVFSDLTSTVASVDTRDSTVIGVTLPAPAADNAAFPLDEPVALSIDDPDQIALLGAGLARDTVDQILGEGIVTELSFVRVAHSTLTDPVAAAEAEMASIVGSAGAKTGVWAQLEAKDHIGLEPGLLIAPGYVSTRPGDAANPVATAMDAICSRIIDCLAVVDTPATSREAAMAYAADFASSLNIVAMYPGAKVHLAGEQVIRPLSPHVAAAIVRRDKQVGNPFKAAWNRPLVGILGASQRVTYRDGDTTCDANILVQAGVGTVIENKTLWAPFTTATDASIRAYRSIKRIRTRRSIEKALLTAYRGYLSEDLGAHLVTLLVKSLEEACEERKTLGALVDYQIVWSRGLNTNTVLRDGGLRLKLRFEETPDLTDLQLYTEPQPEAFDVLAASIADALSSLGSNNVYVAP